MTPHTTPLTSTLAATFAATLCLALAACSAPPTALERIQIVAESGANQNAATAIDIVFAYDGTAAGLLPKTGPDWFANKQALMNGLATGVDVVSLQLPPAITANVDLPARYRGAVAVNSYANYIDQSGQAVGNLTPYRSMTIRLKPNTVVYTGN
jgi:type VI secretion system protein